MDDLLSLRSQAASPLAGRGKVQGKDKRFAAPSGPGHSALRPNRNTTVVTGRRATPSPDVEGEEEIDETEDEGNASTKTASDEWVPASSRPSSTTAIVQSAPMPHLEQAPSPIFEKDVKAGRVQAQPSSKMSVSELAHDLGGLDLGNEKTPQQSTRSTRQSKRVPVLEDDDDSIIIVPNTKAGEGQKKKKR